MKVYCAAKDGVVALRANVSGFFILDPGFGTHSATVGNRPQNHLFTDGHRKVVDMLAGKIIALMAAGVPLFFGTVSDLALPAMHKRFIGQAAPAADIFYGEVFAVRQSALAGNAAPV